MSRRAANRSQRKSMIVQVNGFAFGLHFRYLKIFNGLASNLNVSCADNKSNDASVSLTQHNTLTIRWLYPHQISIMNLLQRNKLTFSSTIMLSLDSPKVSPSQFAFVNIKKADGRRWSVASLPRYS